HRLLVGTQGIVGYVALRGQPRIALDVGEDAVFFSNPDLPDTRSEMSLPLRVRDEIIGVLDVQSMERQAFAEDDVAVLQILADQVALAISNARLYMLSQESIAAERRLRGDLTRDGWRRLLQAEQNLTARSSRIKTPLSGNGWYPEMDTALHSLEAVVDDDSHTRIAIPVRVAGQTVGVISAKKPKDSSSWSSAEIGLMTNLTGQLSSAVERARLYRQAQYTASRQRTIAEVGTRMRTSLQLETMMQTAADEIRQALDLGDVEIRLAAPDLMRSEQDTKNDNGVVQ
ncbi:MAG: GAF domain-containing protein, partial [Anaerolineae bacterium]|nr:GAF domain-containing protein [Anaerolineae bacterium]